MHTITLLPAGRTFPCDEGETILSAAARAGIELPSGCRIGGCGTCKTRIVEGEVDDNDATTQALMDFERGAGLTLLCSAYPLSDVALWAEDFEDHAAPVA